MESRSVLVCCLYEALLTCMHIARSAAVHAEVELGNLNCILDLPHGNSSPRSAELEEGLRRHMAAAAHMPPPAMSTAAAMLLQQYYTACPKFPWTPVLPLLSVNCQALH